MLAADTGMINGGGRSGFITKIARNAGGDLAGACGNATYLHKFLKWFSSGENGEPPEGQDEKGNYDVGVIFRASGENVRFERAGSFVFRAEFYAIGSGAPEACGAMWAGASAKRAIAAAIELDTGTFGEIETVSRDG